VPLSFVMYTFPGQAGTPLRYAYVTAKLLTSNGLNNHFATYDGSSVGTGR
jgi:hypothetical protein